MAVREFLFVYSATTNFTKQTNHSVMLYIIIISKLLRYINGFSRHRLCFEAFSEILYYFLSEYSNGLLVKLENTATYENAATFH